GVGGAVGAVVVAASTGRVAAVAVVDVCGAGVDAVSVDSRVVVDVVVIGVGGAVGAVVVAASTGRVAAVRVDVCGEGVAAVFVDARVAVDVVVIGASASASRVADVGVV